MGAAFGGGSSQTLFGSTGASTFLTKSTTVVAVAFMLTSLTLAYISSSKTSTSIMQDVKAPAEQGVVPAEGANVPAPDDQGAATANSVQPTDEGQAGDTEQK